jgi:hypothetical protein
VLWAAPRHRAGQGQRSGGLRTAICDPPPARRARHLKSHRKATTSSRNHRLACRMLLRALQAARCTPQAAHRNMRAASRAQHRKSHRKSRRKPLKPQPPPSAPHAAPRAARSEPRSNPLAAIRAVVAHCKPLGISSGTSYIYVVSDPGVTVVKPVL